MLMGSDQLDITSCDTMKPISGYDPEKFMYMVRNPSYDQATDDNRQNNIDGFSLRDQHERGRHLQPGPER